MATKKILITVPDELVDRFDRLAIRERLPRATLIVRLAELGMDHNVLKLHALEHNEDIPSFLGGPERRNHK